MNRYRVRLFHGVQYSTVYVVAGSPHEAKAQAQRAHALAEVCSVELSTV